MAIYERLTDRTLATGVTLNDFVHVVITGDTSQNVAGSSYKATIQQIANAITGTTGSSGTSGTSGAGDGQFLPLSGGTVTGNTFFGITSGITIDQVNTRIGLGTTTPQMPLDIREGQGRLTFTGSTGGFLEMSGSTDLPRFQVTIPPYLTKPLASLQLAIRSWDNATRPGYGKVGDGILYASNELNGLNIMNRQGTGTEDYIKFYAGQDANGNIADMMIVGTGATRGYIGLGTETPVEKLDVDGNVKMTGDLTIGTVGTTTPIYVLGIDSNGLVVSGGTGTNGTSGTNGTNGTSGTNGSSGTNGTNGTSGTSPVSPYPYVFGLFSQTGNSVTVSGTTSETTIVGSGIGTLTVPANGFSIGDSFTLKMFGDLGAQNNDTLQIKVKSGSVILGDTGLVTMPTITDNHFMLDIGFTIRATGSTGNASILSTGFFTFITDSSNNYDAQGFTTVNNTTFDTTSSNTLDITAQFSTTNAANFIYSEFLVLNKVY